MLRHEDGMDNTATMASFHQVPILRFTIHQVNSDSPQNQASFLMKNILHAFHLQPLYNTTSTSDVVILHPLSSCLYVIEILFLSTYFSSSSYFWIHKTSIISFIFLKSQQSFGYHIYSAYDLLGHTLIPTSNALVHIKTRTSPWHNPNFQRMQTARFR